MSLVMKTRFTTSQTICFVFLTLCQKSSGKKLGVKWWLEPDRPEVALEGRIVGFLILLIGDDPGLIVAWSDTN